MSKRQRWTPVKGTRNRIYDPVERMALAGVDGVGRGLFALGGLAGKREPSAARPEPRDVLVLRLDRIGDLVMSLPALADLRSALPKARIRLAVGRWSAAIAESAPVDEILVWSAPWVGRSSEGSESALALARRAHALAEAPPDLAIDLQGDVRASWLLWLSGARARVGYANTGGDYLLTDVIPLDETVSWVEQNRRAVAQALGRSPGEARAEIVRDADRVAADRILAEHAIARRPLVAIHPSGGRAIKQWPLERWRAVAALLQGRFGATVLITGSAADAPLAAEMARGLEPKPVDLTGRLSVREMLGLLARLDLFLSPDTGPMHMAAAVGTPSLSVFGPSDPVRYFSGGSGQSGTRHVVARHELWCAPCNLIRKPPAECAALPAPECLDRVSVDQVVAEAVRLLRETGGFTEAGS